MDKYENPKNGNQFTPAIRYWKSVMCYGHLKYEDVKSKQIEINSPSNYK